MTQAVGEADALAPPPEVEAKAPAPTIHAEISAGRQWYMVATLSLLSIVAAIDRNAIALLGDAIKADLKLSDTELGFLIGGSFLLFSALLALPAGWMVDRFNRKRLIGAGAVFWSIATACSGLAHSFTTLFIGRAGVGFAEGVLQPAAFSMIRDGVEPARRGRAFALNSAGGLVGGGLGVIVAGLVLKAAEAHAPLVLPIVGAAKPWQVVFFAIGIGGFPLIALIGLIVEPVRRASPETLSGGGSGLSYGDAFMFMVRRWRQYGPLLATGIMGGLMLSAIAFLSPSVLHRNYGLPLPRVSLIVGPASLVSGLGLVVSGFLIDWLAKRGGNQGPASVILAAIVLLGVPAIAAPLMPSLVGYVTLYVAVVFSGGLLMPGILVLNSRITPSRNAGKIVVLFNLAQFVVGATAGTLIAGLLSDHVFHGVHALAYGVSATGAIFILPALATAWWLRQEMARFTPVDEVAPPASA